MLVLRTVVDDGQKTPPPPPPARIDCVQGAPDRNRLIAPAYAWLWQLTGAQHHLDRGDAIFAGGVRRALARSRESLPAELPIKLLLRQVAQSPTGEHPASHKVLSEVINASDWALLGMRRWRGANDDAAERFSAPSRPATRLAQNSSPESPSPATRRAFPRSLQPSALRRIAARRHRSCAC
jgi:hypothetical protein